MARAGASAVPPGRSGCPGPRQRTGRAVARSTVTAKSLGSCHRGRVGGPGDQRSFPLPRRIWRARGSAQGRCEPPADRVPPWAGSIHDVARAAPQRDHRPTGGYRPFHAHRRACARRARGRGFRVDTNAELRPVVSELLAQRWSPDQLIHHLRAPYQHNPDVRLCHESI